MRRIKPTKSKTLPKLKATVDLDELFSGGEFVLDKGDDFDCSASSAAQEVRAEFRRRYGQIRIKEAADSVTVTVERGSLA